MKLSKKELKEKEDKYMEWFIKQEQQKLEQKLQITREMIKDEQN